MASEMLFATAAPLKDIIKEHIIELGIIEFDANAVNIAEIVTVEVNLIK